MLVVICSCNKKINSQDGRVGLSRQFQVLVRKGMGSNTMMSAKIGEGIMQNILKCEACICRVSNVAGRQSIKLRSHES